MPSVLQLRRGTTAQNNAFTGAIGELSYDTQVDTIRVHDGSTAGGFAMTTDASTSTLTNKTLTSPIINTGTFGTSILPVSADGTTLGSATKEFSDLFLADGSTIQLGNDQDVTITHVADTGILLNGSSKIQFTNAAESIHSDGSKLILTSNSVAFSLPTADGSAGQAMVTDASGNLSFAAAGATISADTSTNTDFLLYFAATTSGALTAVKQDSGLIYNPSTGLLTSAAFAGALTGDVTGTASVATAITAADESSDTSCNVLFVTAATGDLPPKTGTNLTFNSSSGVLTATGFAGALTGDVTGTADVASVATTVTVSDNEATNENNVILFGAGAAGSGNIGVEADGNMTYNPSTGVITATGFAGALTGNVTGTADVATVATTVTITDNESTDESNALIFTAGGDTDGGNLGLESDGTLTYNPSTGVVTATGFAGALTGNVTGNASGSSGSCTGNAATATILATTRAIGGVNFNGSAAIDLPGVNTGGNQDTSGTAAIATTVTVADESSDTSCNVLYTTAATGNLAPKSGTNLTFDSANGNLTTTLFTGTATNARYADLAEMYAADSEIDPGTVVMFGGQGKVVECNVAACTKVAGIVSTDPAHLMNSEQEGVALALAGRVPCKVIGPVEAGDMMISAGNGMAKAFDADVGSPAMGTVIGKAIEDHVGDETTTGVIEVLAMMM